MSSIDDFRPDISMDSIPALYENKQYLDELYEFVGFLHEYQDKKIAEYFNRRAFLTQLIPYERGRYDRDHRGWFFGLYPKVSGIDINRELSRAIVYSDIRSASYDTYLEKIDGEWITKYSLPSCIY
jgi:hypothetical protein